MHTHTHNTHTHTHAHTHMRACAPPLPQAFVKEAEAAGMTQLKGHRSVGGMRASIYNAMPMEGVQTLVDFMKVCWGHQGWGEGKG